MGSIMQEFDRSSRNQTRTLLVYNDRESQEVQVAVAKALASSPRLRILEFLTTKVASLSEIARELGMPLATASLHLASLEGAGLLSSQTAPGKRGRQRIYTRHYDMVVFNLPDTAQDAQADHLEIHMPVGAFVDQVVVPPCGMAGVDSVIGSFDNPVMFYAPERHAAQIVWLTHGYLEYRFPNHAHGRDHPGSLQISMEMCSEAAPSALDWPSDIFLEINGLRIGAWTCPSDFSDKRGSLTPAWWPDWNSQYGQLKVWHVGEDGSSIDGRKISAVRIRDLCLPAQPFISVRVGIDDDAENKGGLNIFGRHFGNHLQDIVMQIDY